MLPVICIAIFFGAGILAAGEKGKKIGELVNCMNEVTMKVLMMIIKLTPIGVFCLMAQRRCWVNGAKIVGSLHSLSVSPISVIFCTLSSYTDAASNSCPA